MYKPAFAAALLASISFGHAADFNDDARQDLLWRDHGGAAVIWEMNGLGVMSRATLAPALDAGSAIVGSGNFFGDGTGAIAWVDSLNRLSFWRIAANAVAQTCVVASAIDPGWRLLGIGDFDGDGIDDVVWLDPDGSVHAYLIDGCSIAQNLALNTAAEPSWTFLGIGDYDGNGSAELFWRDSDGDVVQWRRHNATGILSATLSAGAYAAWDVVAVADFDGDGITDLLLRNAADGLAVWRIKGTKYTAAAIAPANADVFTAGDTILASGFERATRAAPPLSPAWSIVGTADTNGDGRADLVLADSSGNAAIWQMQGASVVASGLVPASGDMPYTELTGWRMRMDRPTLTSIGGEVTLAWKPVSGAPAYTVYASATNSPQSTGVAIAASETELEFERGDAGYADKRYFAVSAHYLGVQLPPSAEAYIVEFAATKLPVWGALAIADFNGDGCPDILGAYSNCVGGFVPYDPYALGLSPLLAPGRAYRDIRFADFNGDGVLDAVANTYACDAPACGGNDTNSQILLFFGNGDGTFTEDPDFAALNVPGGGFGETIVVADFNNDGRLDVFLPKYTAYDPAEHNFLLLNDGTGHFTDIADDAGVAMRGTPLCARPEGAQAVDLNDDGWIDVYAGSHLFLNSGGTPGATPHFADMGVQIDANCQVVTPSPVGLPVMMDEGAKFIDYDNSGRLALAINGETDVEMIHVYALDSIGHFAEVAAIPPMRLHEVWGFNAADVDGDGLTDLVVAGGCDDAFFNGGGISADCTQFGNPHALPRLLVNRGGQFVVHDFFDDGRQPTTRGWPDILTVADFDNSGTSDFIARSSGGDDSALYAVMQRATSADRITVTVVGAAGEQNQAGRVVRVSPVVRPAVVMTQVVDGGSGYLSNSPYDLVFATPYEGAYTIRVRFAGGTYTTTARRGDHVTIRSDGTYAIQ